MLEAILLETPERNLFVVQRVSKGWRSIIECSSALQKKMFLAPDGDALRRAGFADCSTPQYYIDLTTIRLNPALEMDHYSYNGVQGGSSNHRLLAPF